jgi:membrane fusion protein (multidrug efflux system)
MNTKALVILSLILFTGCHQSEPEIHEATAKFDASSPLREDATVYKEYVCQVHAIRHIELRALERGYLQNIFVDEGQLVAKGSPIFKIMPNVYQAELQKQQAEASTMNIEYLNTKGLAEKNIVSANELALAKAKLEKANAEVQMAQIHLGFTDISAPFEGMIGILGVRVGSLIEEGALLTTLSDVSKLWVYFNVPEAEYLDYKLHKDNETRAKVRLKMANGELFDQTGVIETIEADFDNTDGNIEFRATFENPNKILRHGQTGTILMAKPYPNALLIPQKATFEILDKTYVYVINNEEKLEQRLIKIDAELPHLFIVKEGLSVDDKILIDGLRKVHAGEKVDINFIAPDKVRSDLKFHAE